MRDYIFIFFVIVCVSLSPLLLQQLYNCSLFLKILLACLNDAGLKKYIEGGLSYFDSRTTVIGKALLVPYCLSIFLQIEIFINNTLLSVLFLIQFMFVSFWQSGFFKRLVRFPRPKFSFSHIELAR